MKPKIVGIGELLWDLFPSGRVRGGAPANFACQAHSLGADVKVISRVGNDTLGNELISELHRIELNSECIQTDTTAPTGTVRVELSATGEPRFTISEPVAWDHIELDAAALAAVADADVVCFGSLAQRHPISRSTIQELVSRSQASALRVFDVNLRQSFFTRDVIEDSLELANVLKLNQDELPVIAGMFGIQGDPLHQVESLAERFALRLVALTRGESGSLLYSDGQYSDHPGFPTRVRDTVGAGDSFTAAIVVGFLQEFELSRLNAWANAIASYVCTLTGATPPLPPSLADVTRLRPV